MCAYLAVALGYAADGRRRRFPSKSKDLTVFSRHAWGWSKRGSTQQSRDWLKRELPRGSRERRPLLAGFITSAKDEEFVWKTGASGGRNSFIWLFNAKSPRRDCSFKIFVGTIRHDQPRNETD
jgi:hypothetical protein